MPAQADHYVEKLQRGHDNGDWDMNEDWKVITLLIGGNDLCRACDGGVSKISQFEGNICTLEYLPIVPISPDCV